MAINFNTDPYYEDYNEDKKFYRILFKPGLSVQARELTQMQALLQKQIERHGRHFFKEGSKCVGGDFGLTTEFHAVKLEQNFGTLRVDDYLDQLVGKEIQGETSGVVARVITFTQQTLTDPATIYVTYTSASVDKTRQTFNDNEKLFCQDSIINDIPAGSPICSTLAENAIATGASASIERGVYFVGGHFVLVDSQRIILSKYTNTPSGRIGLKIVERIVTADDDLSLLDTAQNSPNFSARGADRYFIDLELKSLPLDSTDDGNFIELERITEGRQQPKAKTSEYNVLGDNLARRTYDESGNYIVKPFQFKLRETLNDGLNQGVYDQDQQTDSGNSPSEGFATLQVSAGKAYVQGYEILTNAPSFIDIEKPRTFETVDGVSSAVELGNYVRVKNVYGMPDTVGDGEVEDYKTIKLFDAPTSTRGNASGNIIGVARARAFEFDSGDQSSSNALFSDDAIFKTFLFDLKMFTKIELSGAADANQVPQGTMVRGVTSRAYGYVNSASSSSTLQLTSVTGTFKEGEQLVSETSHADNQRITSGGTPVTVSAVDYKSFDAVKQLYMDDPDGGEDFTADLELEALTVISGTVTTSGTSVTGFNTLFLSQLRAGDAIQLPSGTDGAAETLFISSIESGTQLTLSSAPSNNVNSVAVTRARSLINDQEKNLLLRRLSNEFVKTLKTESNNFQARSDVRVRREFVLNVSSGSQTMDAGTGSFFEPESNINYQITILAIGPSPSAGIEVGKMINVEGSNISIIPDEGTNTASISSALFSNDNVTKIKVSAIISKRNQEAKSKTFVEAAQCRVINKKGYDSGVVPYGTSAHHPEISLGKADALRLLAVYDSGSPETQASTPSLDISAPSGTFTKGELVEGQTSGATGYIITTVSPIKFISRSAAQFQVGELIEGLESESTATVDSIETGSNVITNRFLLDSGQRDNYYDIAKLILKNNQPKPSGDLLVVFDYFEHGSGDFFTVDSYTSIDYRDIPTYTATRIDPEIRNPNGIYDLRSTVDFRPRVADPQITESGDTFTVIGNSFDFESRTYAPTVSTVVDNSNFDYSLEFYLARNDAVFLTADGKFKVVSGNPSTEPKDVKDIDNAMRIADIRMSPYMINIEDARIDKVANKRFTMRDISLLEQRINNIEYYTSLSLLEKSAETLQIKDANGLDRFKSGFLVDNFGGHKTGDVANTDYRCAIDMTERVLRPKYRMKNIKLEEEATNDAQRTIKHYQKTNDLVTLPYESVVSIEQPYASRIENLNPVLNFAWTGVMKLEPSSDEWFEVDRLPDLTVNVEGNFDTIVAQNRDALGTIWNAPVTEWTGELVNQRFGASRRETRFINLGQARGRAVLSRVLADEVGVQTRTGMETLVVEQIDIESAGDRVLATALIPFMRQNEIRFEAHGMRPNTKVYPFFDKVDVSQYCVRTSGSIAPSENGSTTAVQEDPVWDKVRRIIVSFDKNSNTQQRVTLSRHNKLTGDYGQVASVLTSASNTVDRDVIEFLFDENSDLESNQFGEVFIKLHIQDETGAVLKNFQISEVQFFNENYQETVSQAELDAGGYSSVEAWNLDNALISNVKYTEVVRFENFQSVENMVDGGAEISGRLIDGINYRSDQTTYSEARIKGQKFGSVTFRVRGGTRSIDSTTGVERYISNDDVDPNALVTDPSGYVSGIFVIPDPNVPGNPVFETGERLFRLSSEPNNSEVGVRTFAQAPYTAKGILETRQETFIATRNGRLETREVTENTEVTRVRDLGEQVTGWWDPLAQSIMPSIEGGEFITKVDVFFATKDEAIPVTLQLREMENGLPTRKVLPFGTKTLFPDQVNISQLGDVPTSFEFDAPVYVKDNVEICIVLMSDSVDYNAWISRMGETDIGGERYISEQPYLGVLFKSQNNSTWTAYDYEDLKFTVYRAQFDTSANGELVLHNVDLPYKKLGSNPIQCFEGSNSLKVTHFDHHMYDVTDNTGNLVDIKGVTSGIFGNLSSDLGTTDTSFTIENYTNFPTTGTVTFKIVSDNIEEIESEIVRGDVDIVEGVYTVTNVVRQVDGALAFHADNATIEYYEVNGIPLNEINKTHEIIDAGLDWYIVNTTAAATEDAIIGGENVTASENALIDSYQLMVPNIIFPETNITSTIDFLRGTSASGNQISFGNLPAEKAEIVNRIDYRYPRLMASKVNEDEHNSGERSATVTMTLQSSVDNLSPIVDLERKSITAYANRLDNVKSDADVYPTDTYVAPTSPDGDSGETVYITKRVQLQNPATSIKVIFDAVRNSGSEIQVMYKVLRSDDSTDFDEIGWEYFNTAGETDKVVPTVSDRQSYLEYEYTKNDIPEFIAFAIKIKLNGTNSSEPPLLKDLRAIAIAV